MREKPIYLILFIILFHFCITNAQDCNDEPFVVENDTTILFNITSSGSCWCNSYVGSGSQLLVTQNTNLLDTINALNNTIQELLSSVAILQQKLAKVTISNDTNNMYLTGINLNIVSGSDSTNGSVNGLGNIIVGYNENDMNSTRNGSHNIIVGNNHGYSSYGGIVGGIGNTISGNYSFAVGQNNTASGLVSSVSSGYNNAASGQWSSVSGGWYNIASNQSSSVSGGSTNTASGLVSSVSSGYNNTASGQWSSVSGGWSTISSSYASSVSGGYNNIASAQLSSVAGGSGVTVSTSGGHCMCPA